MQISNNIDEISVVELKKKLDSGESLVLLDVREPHEIEICALKHTCNIPVGQLESRLSELDKYKQNTIIVYCRAGKRGEKAAALMKQHGFPKILNLSGGLLAWADEVDPGFPKY